MENDLFCFRKLRPKSVVDVDGSDYCPGIHTSSLKSTYKYLSRVCTIQCPFVEKKGRVWSSLIGGNVPRFWLCFVAANIHCPKIFCGACESWQRHKFDIVLPLILSSLLKFQHCLHCFVLLNLRIKKVFSFGRRYFIC